MLRTLLLLVLASLVRAQDAAPRLERLAARLEEERTKHKIPGMAIAVVRDDRIVLARGFGLRDVEKGLPVEPDTPFAVGSTTKAFTATLVGMLVDEGKMAWDDPVSRHVPYFELRDEAANAKVTVRDLLCHRTGLTRMGVLWAANAVDRETVLKQVKEAELYAPFRSRFLYNNVMYLAAGVAAGRAAGASWEALLRRRILEPLGMKDAHTSVDRMRADPRAARGYVWHEERWQRRPMRHLDVIAPAGALNAHALDMAQWVRFLLAAGVRDGERLISAESLAETMKPQTVLAPGVAYGLGWFVRERPVGEVLEHGGNIDGFAAAVALLPERRTGFVLLTNVSATPLQASVRSIVWQELFEEGAREEAEGRPVSAEERAPLLGRYRVPTLRVEARVLEKDGRLAIDVPGQTTYVLKWPDEEDRWVFELTPDIHIVFEEPDGGRAPAFTFFQTVRATLPRAGGKGPPRGEEPEPGAKWTEAQMKPLLGKYVLAAAGQEWEILVRDGELAVRIPGQPTHPLEWPGADGCWKIRVDPNQSLGFSGDEGAVTGLSFVRQIVTRCPRAAGAADVGVTLDELMAKAVRGAPAGRLHVRGRVRFVHQGASGTFEAAADGPERYASRLDLAPFGYVRTVVDGDGGFVDSNLQPSDDLSGVELALARLESPLLAFGDWRKAFEKTEIVAREGDVVVVRCVPAEGPAIRKYVAVETGLVLKDERRMPAKGIGLIPITVSYDDYRDVGGVKIPFRQTSESVQTGRIVATLESVEPVDDVPSRLFAR